MKLPLALFSCNLIYSTKQLDSLLILSSNFSAVFYPIIFAYFKNKINLFSFIVSNYLHFESNCDFSILIKNRNHHFLHSQGRRAFNSISNFSVYFFLLLEFAVIFRTQREFFYSLETRFCYSYCFNKLFILCLNHIFKAMRLDMRKRLRA